MPRELLVDLSSMDLSQTEFGIEAIREFNAQRYEMEHLTGIVRYVPDENYLVAYKEVTDEEFWIRGHIPGRPLMPGVIMLEASAQACTFYFKKVTGTQEFLGFAGLDNVKFRGTVEPGDTLYIIVKNTDLRKRRAIFETQGVVGDRMVFEAVITGMPV